MDSILKKLDTLYPRSLLADFKRVFGEESTRKFIEVFSGTTIDVPSRRTIDNLERDVVIYESLCVSTDARQSRKLGEHLANRFGLTRKKVREIYAQMQRRLREDKKFESASERVGELKKSGVKIKHEYRRKI